MIAGILLMLVSSGMIVLISVLWLIGFPVNTWTSVILFVLYLLLLFLALALTVSAEQSRDVRKMLQK